MSNSKKVKAVKPPSPLNKVATFRNTLLLTILMLIGILAYNFSIGDGFFASPATINAIKVKGGTGGSSGSVTSLGKTSKNVGSTTTSQISQLKNVPLSNTTGSSGGTKNVVKNAVSTVGNVVTTVANIVSGTGTAVDTTKDAAVSLSTKVVSQTGTSIDATGKAAVGVASQVVSNSVGPAVTVSVGIAGGLIGSSNTPAGDNIQDKCEKCKAELGAGNKSCDNYCKYVPNPTVGGATGAASINPADSQDGSKDSSPKPDPDPEVCGGGKAPMRVGLYYPTGAAVEDKPNERVCVKIVKKNGYCSHEDAKPCHTIPADQVVLPNGAGAEYTSGQTTTVDGSNIKKRNKNCIDIGGVNVPHRTARLLKDGSIEYCNDGIWGEDQPVKDDQLTQAECDTLNNKNQTVLTYKLINGKCAPQVQRCRPSCSGNNRQICTSEGNWKLEACGPNKTCVGQGICEPIPGYVPPANPVQTPPTPDNSVLADAPGTVNIDTAGTVSGCMGALTFTLVPCSGPLIFGPFGVPASLVCRASACVVGGFAGNKAGDVIYNVTH